MQRVAAIPKLEALRDLTPQKAVPVRVSRARRQTSDIRIRRNTYIRTQPKQVRTAAVQSRTQPKIQIFMEEATIRSEKEDGGLKSPASDKPLINLTLRVKGSSKFVRKVIDNTRKGLTRRKLSNAEVLSPGQKTKKLQEEQDWAEHKVLRDRVFDEHVVSTQKVDEISQRAQSANERVQGTLTGALSVLETFMDAQKDFKLSVQKRLGKIQAEQEEEAEKEEKRNTLPRYMSWRPANYQQEKPARPSRFTPILTASSAAKASQRPNLLAPSTAEAAQRPKLLTPSTAGESQRPKQGQFLSPMMGYRTEGTRSSASSAASTAKNSASLNSDILRSSSAASGQRSVPSHFVAYSSTGFTAAKSPPASRFLALPAFGNKGWTAGSPRKWKF